MRLTPNIEKILESYRTWRYSNCWAMCFHQLENKSPSLNYNRRNKYNNKNERTVKYSYVYIKLLFISLKCNGSNPRCVKGRVILVYWRPLPSLWWPPLTHHGFLNTYFMQYGFFDFALKARVLIKSSNQTT